VAAGDDLSCVRAGPQGEVLVVLLTCANADLVKRLANLAEHS